jgi:DinB superfamily
MMMSPLLAVDEILSILRVTPGRLGELGAGLTPVQREAPPSAGEWSFTEVLAHLRACQDVLGGNIRRIVTEDVPTWRRVSPRTWQRASGYHDWAFEPAFEAFATGRTELLAFLESLPPDAWERTALVTMPAGAHIEQTARFFGDWLAGHEGVHVRALPAMIDAVRGPAD